MEFQVASARNSKADLCGPKQEALRIPRRIEVISGLVEATLIFALSASFSGTLFSEDLSLSAFASLGMQAYLVTATVAGMLQGWLSEMELSFAAPDIVPTLVFSNLIGQAFKSEEVVHLPNALALIFICTILTALGCIGVGKVGLTSKVTSKMPESVFSGFVAIAGILIFSKGLKMSMPKDLYHTGLSHSWQTTSEFLALSLSGLPHGLAMFAYKRFNLGKPDVVLPVILMLPVVLFCFICMLVWGENWVALARLNGWLFDESKTSEFYEPFYQVFVSGQVDWWHTLTLVPVWLCLSSMFLVGDIFFKTLGTVKLLNPRTNIDNEMILAGGMNIGCALLGGVPGYAQMKLAAINHTIIGSQHVPTRYPSYIASFILGLLLISGAPLAQYVPRFWLSGILYSVGISFIVESTYDISWNLYEKLTIGSMVAVFLLRNQLRLPIQLD